MYLKNFFNKLFGRYLWLHLLGMAVFVVLLCVGAWYALASYTLHGQGIVVPELNGMSYSEASTLLSKDGLFIAVADSGYNKRMPANTVLAQKPVAGAVVKTGRTIYVTVNSLTSPTAAIPDLIDNCSYREASAQLSAMGFKLTEPKEIEGEKDWVYGIECNGRPLNTGEQVSLEQTLTLVIGKGTDEEDDGFGLDDDLDMEGTEGDNGEAATKQESN